MQHCRLIGQVNGSCKAATIRTYGEDPRAKSERGVGTRPAPTDFEALQH